MSRSAHHSCSSTFGGSPGLHSSDLERCGHFGALLASWFQDRVGRESGMGVSTGVGKAMDLKGVSKGSVVKMAGNSMHMGSVTSVVLAVVLNVNIT